MEVKSCADRRDLTEERDEKRLPVRTALPATLEYSANFTKKETEQSAQH